MQGPAEEPEPERDSVDNVAPEQPTRFVQEPVHPLQAQSLQRGRRARLLLGEEAEGDSNSHEPGPGQLGSEQPDQPLLLRKSEPHQHQRRLRAPKRLLILSSSAGSCSNPKGGSTTPLPRGRGQASSARRRRRPPRDSPQQEHGQPRAGGCPRQAQHQVAARGPSPATACRPAARPRRSAGHRQRDEWRPGSARGSRDRGEPAKDVEIRGDDPATVPARAPSRKSRVSVAWSSLSKGRPMIERSGGLGAGSVGSGVADLAPCGDRGGSALGPRQDASASRTLSAAAGALDDRVGPRNRSSANRSRW